MSRAPNPLPPVEQLRELLVVVAGELVWREPSSPHRSGRRRRMGSAANYVKGKGGYRRVWIHGRSHPAHLIVKALLEMAA